MQRPSSSAHVGTAKQLILLQAAHHAGPSTRAHWAVASACRTTAGLPGRRVVATLRCVPNVWSFLPPIICNTRFLIGNFFVQHSNKHFAFKFCLSSLTQGCWSPFAKMPMTSPNEQLEGLGLLPSLLLGARSVHAYTEHSLQDKRGTEQLTANETNRRLGLFIGPTSTGQQALPGALVEVSGRSAFPAQQREQAMSQGTASPWQLCKRLTGSHPYSFHTGHFCIRPLFQAWERAILFNSYIQSENEKAKSLK